MPYKAFFQVQVVNTESTDIGGGTELTLGLAGEGLSVDKAVLNGIVQVKKMVDSLKPEASAH